MRRKKQPTRRQKALRALAILVFMVLYIVIPGRFYFLPSQAIQEAERLGNIGPTRLIYEFPGEEGRMLRGNDKGLMVCTLKSYVSSLGCEAEYCAFLDCTEPSPFHVGFCKSYRWGNWYGRIDDPAAAAIRLEYYVFYREKELREAFTIEKEDWIEWDGHFYFALEFEQSGWPQYNLAHSELLDREGNLIGSQDIFLDWFGSPESGEKAMHQ